jgi:hypothetical protein
MFEQTAGAGRAAVIDADVVFHHDRDAGKRAGIFTRGDSTIDLACVLHGSVIKHVNERIQSRLTGTGGFQRDSNNLDG